MSVQAENGKKWIQASVAITAMIVAYVFMSFFAQLGEWFELESKIPQFNIISQVLGGIIGLGTFIYIMKNDKTSSFLEETYGEIQKVVWPILKIQTSKPSLL